MKTLLRIVGLALVPLDDQLMPLRFRQQRQIRHSRRGGCLISNRFEQGMEMARHPFDAGGIKQVAVVQEMAFQPARLFREVNLQVKSDGSAIEL